MAAAVCSVEPSVASMSTTARVARGLGTAWAAVAWCATDTEAAELSAAAANSNDLRLRVIMPVAGAAVANAGVRLTEREGSVANDVGRITVDAEVQVAAPILGEAVVEAAATETAAMLGDATARLLAADGDDAADVEADAAPNGVTLANKDDGEGVARVDTKDDTNGRRANAAEGSGTLSVSAAGAAIGACGETQKQHGPNTNKKTELKQKNLHLECHRRAKTKNTSFACMRRNGQAQTQ